MEFQITVTEMRDASALRGMPPAETDCVITAEPQHRVGELASALARLSGVNGWSARPDTDAGPDLWLDGARLDPATSLVSSGIRDGSRVGLGGSPPGSGHPSSGRRPWRGVAEIRVVSGADAGLVVPVTPGEYTIARERGDVLLTDTDVSRQAHCIITIAEDRGSPDGNGLSCSVRDARSTNGTGLDGAPVGTEPVPVRPGQLIGVGREYLTIAPPPAERAVVEPGEPGDPLGQRLSRPPRGHSDLPKPVVIDLAAEQGRREGLPSWLTMLIAPVISLAVGGAVVALTGQWFFLLLGLRRRRRHAGHPDHQPPRGQSAAAHRAARVPGGVHGRAGAAGPSSRRGAAAAPGRGTRSRAPAPHRHRARYPVVGTASARRRLPGPADRLGRPALGHCRPARILRVGVGAGGAGARCAGDPRVAGSWGSGHCRARVARPGRAGLGHRPAGRAAQPRRPEPGAARRGRR